MKDLQASQQKSCLAMPLIANSSQSLQPILRSARYSTSLPLIFAPRRVTLRLRLRARKKAMTDFAAYPTSKRGVVCSACGQQC